MNIHKYPSWKYVADCKSICEPFFDKFGVNYFDYAKFFPASKELQGLSTDGEWLDHFFNEKFHIVTTVYREPGKYIWNGSEKVLNFVHDAREGFNHDFGITFVRKKADYIESFSVAASREKSNILNVWLNNEDNLFKFVDHYFLEKSKKLFSHIKNKPILITSELCGNNVPIHEFDLFEQVITTKKSGRVYYPIKTTCGNIVNLTQREFQSLILLKKGYTSKEIARELLTSKNKKLSHRTVNDYINRLKDKLDCHRRIEITSKILNFGCELS